MSFAFVPRKVASAKKSAGAGSAQKPGAINSQSISTGNSEPIVIQSTKDDEEGHHYTQPEQTAASYSEEDFVAFLKLALSDYEIWADSDLRRVIDTRHDLTDADNAKCMSRLCSSNAANANDSDSCPTQICIKTLSCSLSIPPRAE